MASSAKWPIKLVRDTFFTYFESNLHSVLPSSPLIPIRDPTAPIIDAALSQFLPSLEGTELLDNRERSTCFSLKCIRAGGEALEHFRKDTSYHSLTELLVSVSFRDFLAIALSLKLLTMKYGLPKDKIQLSYFGGYNQFSGDEESGKKLKGGDEESEKILKSGDEKCEEILKKHLPAERIVSIMGKDNFWSAGDTGPCGPCITIKIESSGSGDNTSFVEVLRLVFVKFDRSDGVLNRLKGDYVITIVNVESLASILQEKGSHYKSDFFAGTIESLEYYADQSEWYQDRVDSDDEGGVDMAYRIVADHLRTVAATTPYHAQLGGTEGREYFLKCLDKQAVQFGYEVLKLEKHHYKESKNCRLKLISQPTRKMCSRSAALL